jgi:hypothetical protein
VALPFSKVACVVKGWVLHIPTSVVFLFIDVPLFKYTTSIVEAS